MSRFCSAWTNHTWVRTEGLDLVRHCVSCGLLEPRQDQPDPDTCDHEWEALTFRCVCRWCGQVDHSRVLGPSSKGPVMLAKSDNWRGRVRLCFLRDGAGCFYCGCSLEINDARLDHFIPRSKGGADSLVNRRAACKRCDVSKQDRMPWEFMPERFDAPSPAAEIC